MCSSACILSCAVVSNSVTPWTVGPQAPLSMEFSRQEYWSGLPFPSPGNLPHPRIEPTSLESPELAGFLTTGAYALGVPSVWAAWGLLLWWADYCRWSGMCGWPLIWLVAWPCLMQRLPAPVRWGSGWQQGPWDPRTSASLLVVRARFLGLWWQGTGSPRADISPLVGSAGCWGSWLRDPRCLRTIVGFLVGKYPRAGTHPPAGRWGWVLGIGQGSGRWSWVLQFLDRVRGFQGWCQPAGGWNWGPQGLGANDGPLVGKAGSWGFWQQGPGGLLGLVLTYWWAETGSGPPDGQGCVSGWP